jgi:hypothetical protein
MDALAGLLDGPRAQGAFLLKVVLGPPWSLHIADEAPLASSRIGGAAYRPRLDRPVQLAVGYSGHPRPDHYVVADPTDRAPALFIGPARLPRRETTADGMRLGVRTGISGVGTPIHWRACS